MCAVQCDRAAEAVRGITGGFQFVCDGSWSDAQQTKAIGMMKKERFTHLRNPHERLMEELDSAVLCMAYARPSSLIEVPAGLQKKQFVSLARSVYHPDNMCMICLGPNGDVNQKAIDASEVVAFHDGTLLAYPPCERTVKIIKTESPSSSEAFLRMDLPGFGLQSPEHFINRIAANLLSGPLYALEAQLGENGSALCYDLFSDTAEFHSFAQINLGAACLKKDLTNVKEIILKYICALPQNAFHSNTWELMRAQTEQEVKILESEPYDLFDFLMLESDSRTIRTPEPRDLLYPWTQDAKRIKELLKRTCDPAAVAIAIAA